MSGFALWVSSGRPPSETSCARAARADASSSSGPGTQAASPGSIDVTNAMPAKGERPGAPSHAAATASDASRSAPSSASSDTASATDPITVVAHSSAPTAAAAGSDGSSTASKSRS